MSRLARSLLPLLVLASSLGAASPSPSPAPPAKALLGLLFSPGKLIKGHASFESDCLKCHEPKKGVPDAKCLDCHKEIARDVDAHHGFHGGNTQNCVKCHQDHRGRDFDSTKLDPKTFDHRRTGFVLKGGHSKAQCADCHDAKRGAGGRDVVRPAGARYFGLSSSCVKCHADDDVHHFTGEWAKKDCDACHKAVSSWKRDIVFDHARDAHYKLEGAHAKLKCAACHQPDAHKPPIYRWPDLKGNQCLSCHKDQHAGMLSPKFAGGACTQCHNQVHWAIPHFDHAATGYPLKGKHARIQCVDCHKATASVPLKSPDFKFTGLSSQCISCHTDPHGFDHHQSGFQGDLRQCEKCHTETRWKPAPLFDHRADTRFPIVGKHLGVACNDCHIKSKTNHGLRVYHWDNYPQKTCEICHKSPHVGVFPPELLAKRCTDCHVAAGWKAFPKEGSTFDHDMATRFPLTGAHRKAKCIACHKSGKEQVYTFTNAEKGFCIDCHKNVHVGQFEEKFASMACGKCHSTDDFARLSAFDHSATDFPLTGKHQDLDCSRCHKTNHQMLDTTPPKRAHRYVFDGKDRQFCAACHEDPHGGAHGPDCVACHTTTDWKKQLDFHKNFALTGVHVRVGCRECHRDWTDLTGMSRKCVFCHEKDDIHSRSLPRCAECHTQQVWSTTTFRHSLTTFPLRGFHRTIDCNSCHIQGIYNGTPTSCAACHQAQALAFTGNPNHQLLIGRNCLECHNQFTFGP